MTTCLSDLLKTRGVCLVDCVIRPESIQVGIAIFEVVGSVSVSDGAGDRYCIEIPQEAKSPMYRAEFWRIG